MIDFGDENTFVVFVERITRMSTQTTFNVHAEFLAFVPVNCEILQPFWWRIVLNG